MLVIPGFDVFDPRAWGPVTLAIAAAGFVATLGYFALRARHVTAAERTPWWVWWAAGMWWLPATGVAALLYGRIAFAFTVGGLLGAAPQFAWAARLLWLR